MLLHVDEHHLVRCLSHVADHVGVRKGENLPVCGFGTRGTRSARGTTFVGYAHLVAFAVLGVQLAEGLAGQGAECNS